MSKSSTATLDQRIAYEELGRGPSFASEVRRFVRTSRVGAFFGILLVVTIFVAFFAEQFAPYHPLEADFTALRSPPSADHWLGTDNLGRDVLSRLIYGTRLSLLVAIISTVIGKVLGLSWGVLTGYLGGPFDLISQRVIDVLLAFPGIILAMLLLAAMGGGFVTVVVAITILSVAGTVRVIRSVVLPVKELAFVEAARAIGVSSSGIMFKHVTPQTIAPLLVLFSASLGSAIFAEAALSFLGLGIPQPQPSLGNMLGGVLANQFRPQWWLVIFPGMAITFLILAFNLVGDTLRDFLDPKLRGRLG